MLSFSLKELIKNIISNYCISFCMPNLNSIFTSKPRIIKNEFLESYNLGIKQLHIPAFCHISDGVEVEAWPLENVY